MVNLKDKPDGATHYHPGNEKLIPHYIRVVGDKRYTWIHGTASNAYRWANSWCTIPIEDYESI